MANLLTDHCVLVTAVKPTEREELAKSVEQCGGVFLSGFSTKDPPHLVITRSVRSPKYRALLRAHPHTPVVTPEWLTASVQAGQRMPYDAYHVGPFHGLTVCFSGLNAAKKAALATLVVHAGGHHSPALDKKCTHLVTNSTDSDKYRFAVENSIVSVTIKWVEDGLRAGWCQEEAPYAIVEQAAGAKVAAAAPNAAPSAVNLATLLDEATSISGLVSAASTDVLAVAPTVFAGGSSFFANAQQAQQQLQLRGPSRLERGSSLATEKAKPGGAEAMALARPWQVSRDLLEEQLEWDDGLPTYLDAVRLRLLGCTPSEAQECLQLVRQSAAKRFSHWPSDLNHLVVGSDLGAAEAAEALDFLAAHRSCMLVNLDWLRESVAAQQRLHPDGFQVPLSRLAQYRRKLLAVEAAGHAERTTSSGGGDDGCGDLGRTQSMAPVTGPLAGCYFTLAAIKGTDAEQHASRLIREAGGRLFTETTLQRVTVKSRAYAICPVSLVPQEITQLRGACHDFKLVEDRHRFTLYWLECSLQAGGPLPSYRGAPLYQPLPFPLPMPSMRDVVVSISGYIVEARAAIARTVEVLGGRVTMDTMTRRNTHLILPEGKGRKFEYCAAFGVVPVTADWLVDTVQVGQRQAEATYYPRLPPSQQAQLVPAAGGGPLAARLAAAVGDARDGGATQQIGNTQAVSQHQGRVQGLQQPLCATAPTGIPAAQEERPQLVLPPPPTQQQQQQQPWMGGRGPTLRECMRAAQAAAKAEAAVGAPEKAALRNDENASRGNKPSSLDGDLLHLGAKQLTTSFQQQQQQQQEQRAAAAMRPLQRQPSALDEAMASLDEGLKQQQEEQVRQSQQEMQGAPKSSSMFDSLFPSNQLASGAAPALDPAAAATAAARAVAPVAAAGAPAGANSRDQPWQPGGQGSARAQRGSSRLRPTMQASPPRAEPQAAAEGPPAAEPNAGQAALPASAAAGGGSDVQDDFGRAVAMLSNLIDGLPPEGPPPRGVMVGTQLDGGFLAMRPPPARGRAGTGKRGAAAPADSSLSNGSVGGSCGGRAGKRPIGDEAATSGDSSGRVQPRRSGRGPRGGMEVPDAVPHIDMSQQVGYADADYAAMPPGISTCSSTLQDKQLLKRQLVETAAAGRQLHRGAGGAGGTAGAAASGGRSADPLADLL